MLHTEIDLLIRHFDTFAQAKARSDLNLFLGWAGGWGGTTALCYPCLSGFEIMDSTHTQKKTTTTNSPFKSRAVPGQSVMCQPCQNIKPLQ